MANITGEGWNFSLCNDDDDDHQPTRQLVHPFQYPSSSTLASSTSNCSGRSISDTRQLKHQQPSSTKKKRNMPGTPDPEAEVIALSPRTLMTTNRFVCEICSKGFQREQNLQLHRRGHNLPWKLRQRVAGEVKKRVYVCPEPSCVHHRPERALGDLTGIKKHFCRKHGEKKWKCEKCSKKYAVLSDCKAHVKTCGTREYKCHCGTIFSRRDSFVTHRAFCDALTNDNSEQASSRRLLSPGGGIVPNFHTHASSPSAMTPPGMTFSDSKIPLLGEGLSIPKPAESYLLSGDFFGTAMPACVSPTFNPAMSATALLQKAAQIGTTVNGGGSSTGVMASSSGHHHHHHQLGYEHHHHHHFGGESGLLEDIMTVDFLGVGGHQNGRSKISSLSSAMEGRREKAEAEFELQSFMNGDGWMHDFGFHAHRLEQQ